MTHQHIFFIFNNLSLLQTILHVVDCWIGPEILSQSFIEILFVALQRIIIFIFSFLRF